MNDDISTLATPIRSLSGTREDTSLCSIGGGSSSKYEKYRRILVTSGKLATLQGDLNSVADFFSNELIDFYQSKLRDESLKLFFESNFNLDHYRKAEEIIWKRIYHDIYRLQKEKRQTITTTKRDECLLQAHFISGIGFYSNLVIKLRYGYGLCDLQGLIKPLNMKLGPFVNVDASSSTKTNQIHRFEHDSLMLLHGDDHSMMKSQNVTKSPIGQRLPIGPRKSLPLPSKVHDRRYSNDPISRDWARQAIYRSLVYMGDLARYLFELSSTNYKDLAFNFYLSATYMHPDFGLPYNQLATLAGNSSYNLHAVTNYMRCCLKPKPFDAAEANMRKLFQLNEHIYNEEIKKKNYIAKKADVLASACPSHAAEIMVKAITVIFIKLTSDIWSAAITGSLDKNRLIEETHLFFESLREALDLDQPSPPDANNHNHNHLDQLNKFMPISVGTSNEDDEKPRFITPTIMYEFCCIAMMLIHKCQSRVKPSEILIEIEPFPSESLEDLVNTLALNLLHYSTSKCYKMVLKKVIELRLSKQERKKKLEGERGEKPIFKCMAPSLQYVIRTKARLDQQQYDNNDDQMKQSLGVENNTAAATNKNTHDQYNNEDYDNELSAMAYLYTQTYLPSIKIICDWLLGNGNLVIVNEPSFHNFRSDLGDLNTLLRECRRPTKGERFYGTTGNPYCYDLPDSLIFESHDYENMTVYQNIFNGPLWRQRYPLSCDFPLYNLKPLELFQGSSIDFDYPQELDEFQSGFIIMQCIEAFFHVLTIFLERK